MTPILLSGTPSIKVRKQISPEDKNFILHTQQVAQEHNVQMFLSKRPWVQLSDMTRSNGYFDDSFESKGYTSRLAVACGQPYKKWFGILLHESSHMDQWIEDTFIWKNQTNRQEPRMWDLWLDPSSPVSASRGSRYLDKLVLLESDCEIRSAKKIKDFSLSLYLQEYCQNANAYIYFYHFLKKSRTWYKIGQEPYNIKEITSKMPKTMLPLATDYLHMPTDYLKLYEKYYNPFYLTSMDLSNTKKKSAKP